MKPVAPALRADDSRSELPSLQSEIRRLCDAKAAEATDERATIPAPPSVEALRAATPYPPPSREEPSRGQGQRQSEEERQRAREREAELETIPAPPPASSARTLEGRDDEGEAEGERVPSTIPGPPRMPRIAG
jgi:hypothetical protein